MTTYSSKPASGQQETAPRRDFAKVFPIGQRSQLLVWLDVYDDDDQAENYGRLHQMVDLGAALVDIALCGPVPTLQNVLAAYDHASAERFELSTLSGLAASLGVEL